MKAAYVRAFPKGEHTGEQSWDQFSGLLMGRDLEGESVRKAEQEGSERRVLIHLECFSVLKAEEP